MSIVFGAIMPHPPILVPPIGKERLKEAEESKSALEEMAFQSFFFKCLFKREERSGTASSGKQSRYFPFQDLETIAKRTDHVQYVAGFFRGKKLRSLSHDVIQDLKPVFVDLME